MRKVYKKKKRACGLCKPWKQKGQKMSTGRAIRLRQDEQLKEMHKVNKFIYD